MAKKAKMEQETIITTQTKGGLTATIRSAADEDVWHVFSEHPTKVREYNRTIGPGKQINNSGGTEWIAPKSEYRVQIRPKRKMSAEQKAVLAERAKKNLHSK